MTRPLSVSVFSKNNIKITGNGKKALLFAHGYGCDQSVWRFITPAFEDEYQVVLFDHVGAGQSDLSAYSRTRYGSLQGYADDVLDICRTLSLKECILVGHSVSAMIGVLAAIKEPARFEKLVLLAPSPCFINDGDYIGGFTRKDIEELLDTLDSNHLGWSSTMAPMIMGNLDRPELAAELTNSFCRTDPDIAKHFARVTFLSDTRAALPKLKTRSQILQCSQDAIAPVEVGKYLHRTLADSQLVVMRATGHCPHLSAPEETIAAMKGFL